VIVDFSFFSLTSQAPEVVTAETYTDLVDSFSFGIMINSVLKDGEGPYGTSSGQNIELKVSRDPTFRPTIPKEWRAKNDPDRKLLDVLIRCMIDCWAALPEERPTMKEVQVLLNEATSHDDDVVEKRDEETKIPSSQHTHGDGAKVGGDEKRDVEEKEAEEGAAEDEEKVAEERDVEEKEAEEGATEEGESGSESESESGSESGSEETSASDEIRDSLRSQEEEEEEERVGERDEPQPAVTWKEDIS